MKKLVYESLNSFIRNQNPIKSLSLGYEGKIRSFFRSFNVPDEDYKVKEDGEIVFNTDLDLDNTPIRELPANLTINGSLSLNNTQIRELPANLIVKGYLNLRNTQIRELPANLTVKGSLYLEYTQIRELPANLTVKYSIYVNEDQIELIDFIKQSKFNKQLKIKE
jgi:hypothetical protein